MTLAHRGFGAAQSTRTAQRRGLRPGQEGLATKGCPRADASGAKAPAR